MKGPTGELDVAAEGQRFIDKLLEASRRNDSLLCVGLDVDARLVPPHLVREDGWVEAFNQGIVEATADLVCAYKPNLAFYEALGMAGWKALRRTLELIPPEIPVIADAKRADVGHSSLAYARALFEVWGFDAATVNPYLGYDSLEPFLGYGDRGVLVLCKTSNPGSMEFQDLLCAVDGREVPLYLVVAEKVREWDRSGNAGVVVGATFPDELAKVRQVLPDAPVLVPGVGAQAGDLEAAVRLGTDARGERAIVNASRQVIYASAGRDWAEAAREAARELRDAINAARRAKLAVGEVRSWS